MFCDVLLYQMHMQYQQREVKAKLVEYKYEKNGILSLVHVCPCASDFIVEVDIIHHGRMTSYYL